MAAARPGPDGAVGVVMVTRDRPVEAAAAVARLRALPERPRLVVVVNGGPVPALRPGPDLDVVVLSRNRGAGGRDLGVERCGRPVVAFCDDDSWWRPGALARAAAVLARHPQVGLVQGRIVVEPAGVVDPFCREVEASPLVRRPGPGTPILGFMACGAVVRRRAFLEAGGFGAVGIGGEEGRLALDLASAGWDLRYVPEVVAHHRPSPVRDPRRRARAAVARDVLTAWHRLPVALAARVSVAAVRRAPAASAVGGLWDAARAWPRLRHQRRVAAPATVRERALLLAQERARRGGTAGARAPHPGPTA